MKFLSLTLKMKTIFSSMMGISSYENKMCAYGSNSIQSPNNFFETFITIIVKTVEDLFVYAAETIIGLVYAIVKWALTAIDFLFLLIRQFLGMNGDFSASDSLTESDMIFKFVFNEEVIDVIRGMIGFSLILLILFSIFAIIKNEYDFAVNGGSNSKKQVLTNALRSLSLMVLVPVLFIGGLILSSALAKTIYIAMSGGTDTMLGPNIFTASTYDSNRYRKYAKDNYKIPITFSFDEIGENDNINGWGTDGDIAELDQALKDFNSSDAWNRGMTTFLMFYTDGYLLQSGSTGVDKLNWKVDGTNYVKNTQTSYGFSYDRNIFTCRDQYFAMADMLDFAIKNEMRLYYKTPEQLVNSYGLLSDGLLNIQNSHPNQAVKDQASEILADTVDVNALASIIPDVGLRYNNPSYVSADTTEVYVKYDSFDKTHKLEHVNGAKSESDGAVFLMCTERVIEVGDTVFTYYYPLLHYGDEVVRTLPMRDKDGNLYGSAIDTFNVIVARGMFTEEGYPTAIKEEDGVIHFYRDDLNIPTLLDFFPTISYEMPEGATEDFAIKLIKKGVEAVTGIDITQFIPYIYYNIDIFNLFTKKTYNIVSLDEGYLKVNYNFTQDGYVIKNLYSLMNLNLVILLFASVFIIGMMLKIIFGLAHRVMDVTLMAITYPAVLATYTLDNGSRFKNWSQLLLQKILSIYGVVIGVNLILLFIPVLQEMTIFDSEMISDALDIGLLASGYAAGFLNELIRMLFLLVLFTMLERATGLVENLLSGQKDKGLLNRSKDKTGGSGILAAGEETVNELKKVPATIATLVSGKALLDLKLKAATAVASVVPGGAAAAEGLKKIQDIKKIADAQKGINSAKKDVKNASGGGSKPSKEKNGGGGAASGGSKSASGGGAKPGSGGSKPAPNGGPKPDKQATQKTGGSASAENAEAPKDQNAPGGKESSGAPTDAKTPSPENTEVPGGKNPPAEATSAKEVPSAKDVASQEIPEKEPNVNQGGDSERPDKQMPGDSASPTEQQAPKDMDSEKSDKQTSGGSESPTEQKTSKDMDSEKPDDQMSGDPMSSTEKQSEIDGDSDDSQGKEVLGTSVDGQPIDSVGAEVPGAEMAGDEDGVPGGVVEGVPGAAAIVQGDAVVGSRAKKRTSKRTSKKATKKGSGKTKKSGAKSGKKIVNDAGVSTVEEAAEYDVMPEDLTPEKPKKSRKKKSNKSKKKK